jgi:hypothetical protein
LGALGAGLAPARAWLEDKERSRVVRALDPVAMT